MAVLHGYERIIYTHQKDLVDKKEDFEIRSRSQIDDRKTPTGIFA